MSSRRRPPARPTGAPSPSGSGAPVPVVGAREPCPCGSGKRYKACHGKGAGEDRRLVSRPFAGRVDETEWVALREIVPAATAPLRLKDFPDRDVTLSTVLPLAWPAMVRADGKVFLGLQVQSRSGDVSRDLAAALEQALEAAPGTSVQPTGLPGAGPRLQDLLTDEPLEPTLHHGFDYWVEGADDPTGEVAASMERANASVVPTARLEGGAVGVLVPDEGAHPPALGAPRGRGPAARRAGPAGRRSAAWRSGPTPATSGPSAPTDCSSRSGTHRTTGSPASWRSRSLPCARAWTRRWPTARPLTGEQRRARSGLLSRQLTLN